MRGANRKMTDRNKSFIKGAAILGAAALLSKLLGAIYRIPFQNLAGDEGLGIYNIVYPVYTTLLIIATAGFPIAVSKLVSERLAIGDTFGAKRILKISSLLLTFTGIIFFALLFFGAEWIALNLFEDSSVTLAIKAVSTALIVVPLMAVLRGYYQGHQDMFPTGLSQIIEQIVRVTSIIVLTYWFMNNGFGVEYAAAGATFGAFTGSFAALIVVLFFWKRIERQTITYLNPVTGGKNFNEETSLQIMKKIIYIALPICFGSLVLPLLNLADSVTVPKLLNLTLDNPAEATSVFGLYGHGIPLVQVAAIFATSLSLALVPAISEGITKGNNRAVGNFIGLSLKLTVLIGLPASVGLAIIAEPTNVMLYKSAEGSDIISVLAFTTLFSTLGITTTGILQGMGLFIVPARNLIIGVIIKIILNIVLINSMGIIGAAWAMVVAYLIASSLNIRTINRHSGVVFSLKDFFIRPFISVAVMGIVVYAAMVGMETLLLSSGISERLQAMVIALVSVGLGGIVYAIALFKSGALTRQDISVIPKLGNKLIPLLEKFRLL